MAQRWIFSLTVLVTFVFPACFAHHLAVVVNKDNPVQNVTSAQLAKMCKGDVKKWPDGKEVVLVLHASSPGELVTLEHLNRMSSAEVKTMLANHKDFIRTVASDADVIGAVSSIPGAFGFVEEHSLNDHVTVIRVDGKLPLESGYLPH